jgi:PLP dependent protein
MIASRLATVRARIDDACRAVGRDCADVTLIAVSKGHPAESIAAAYDAGQRVFGESYPGEYRAKVEQLAGLQIQWHFIGHAQRNKIKWVVGPSAMVHSLDDLAGIAAFNRRAELRGVVQDVLLQVNLGEEPSKRGCRDDEVADRAAAIDAAAHLRLRGLMTLPPPGIDPTPHFARLRALRDRLPEPARCDILSMGMSGDFAAAIAAGATHLRVGTAIFGPRPTPQQGPDT